MNTYLFSRRDYDTSQMDALTLSHSVFFQMWQKRQHPSTAISEGDVVFIGDTKTRIVSWEVRVTRLVKGVQYDSTLKALHMLRKAYGLEAKHLNNYHRDKTGPGFLFAWAPTVMRELDIRLPAGQAFGRNGYRDLSAADLIAAGLPVPKRRVNPLAESPDWYQPAAIEQFRPQTPSRYIPLHVRRAVSLRDGGRCIGCRATSQLHYDHITPFVRGGPSTVDNLRVICAYSNLRRGVGEPNDRLACDRRRAGPGARGQLGSRT